MNAAAVVGALDIGGSHVSGGRIDLAAASVAPGSHIRVPLSPSGRGDEVLPAIVGVARAVTRDGADALGVAAPGPFDYSAGVSRIEHKLTGLYGVDLRAELGAALGLADPGRIRFVNDAEAFVLGEWWAGAARGHARVLGITLGTGLGSAFLADGRFVREGPAVPPDGALYPLSFRGAPVEEAISGRALLAAYGRSDVDVEQVAGRARAGDPKAIRAFDGLARAIGEFVAPWVRTFTPSCLVVGGAIARSWDLLEVGLRAALAAADGGPATLTVAEKLDDAPLLGAARFASFESA